MAKFDVWEIENFSCWNIDIHSDGIRTGHSFYNLVLYPRGVGGKSENLVVSSLNISTRKLSFIGSDGTVICTRSRQPDVKKGKVIFIGPKFEDVVARIRGDEPLHKDRLILRWETTQDRPFRLRTVIDTYSAFFHIRPEVFGNPTKPDWKAVGHIGIPFKYKSGCIIVTACKTGSTLEDTKVNFELRSNIKETILERTSIWMLNGDTVIRKHEDDCVIGERDSHILPYGILLKELQNLQIIVRYKFIFDELVHDYYSYTESLWSPDFRIPRFSKSCEIKSLRDTSAVVSDATTESISFLNLRDTQPKNAVAALTKDFMCLYQDHDFTDFELRCGTVSFPTHRNILSARSPVLKAMLSGDMTEAACGHVAVEDLDPHTLGRFLAFLYSGTSEDLEWESSLKLYYAADKYQVPSLKEECSAVLRASVSLETVCDILSLADRHQDEELRSVAHDFILENYNEVLGSKKWEKLVMSDPLLVAKTVTDFAKKKVMYVKK